MSRDGGHLDELLAFGLRLFRRPADFEGDVALAEANSNLLQERSRRRASGKDPDKVVGDFLLLAGNIKDDGLSLKLDRIRVKNNIDLS